MEAVSVGWSAFFAKGAIMRTRIVTCTITETIWTRLYCLFLAQRGFTGTGLLVSFKGGSLGGEIQSRKLRQKTRYSGGCSISMLELVGATFGVLIAALKLSAKLLS